MATTRVNGVDISVVQEGKVVRVPEGVPLIDVYTAIGREITSQEEDVAIDATIEAFVYTDAAYQFHRSLEIEFGFVAAKRNMFGGTDNSSLQVEVAPGEFVQVPWGRFEVPGVAGGWLSTGTKYDDFGRQQFRISGVVKRKHEKRVLDAISLTTKLVREESIYRGKALDIRLKDDDGSWLPMPDVKFVTPDPTLRERVVFARATQASVDTSLYAPIEFREQARARGIPLKRGVLLYGPFGTGKTLSMDVAAALAVKHGWTYIKARRADELADLMRLSTQYLGATVLTCEDVDQVLMGERSITMNDLLNTIDTTDKKVELVVALSTNYPEKINKAMLRAGRLDAAIYVAPPDAEATERLMRQYGNGQINAKENISAAAQLMAGNNAGDIREVVERAKLAELRRNPTLTPESISGEDLLLTAEMMQPELELRREVPDDTRSSAEKAAAITAAAIEKLGDGYVSELRAAAVVSTLE